MTLSQSHYQANRLDLLSRLAGDISHEIKNPLHAMVINLELVRRRVEKGDSAAAIERVGIVEDEIRKVHALANGLLEALRPSRDNGSACGFTGILEEIAPLATARAHCARVNMELQAEPSSLTVPLAAHELRLLLLNLVDRAVRSAPPGSILQVSATPAADHVTIDMVSDGAAVDDVESGWLRDHPVDAEHIELGLRVVRDIVTRTGGRIAMLREPDGRHRLSVVLGAAASA